MTDGNLFDNPECVTEARVEEEVERIRAKASAGLYLAATELEVSLHVAVLAAIGRGILAGDGAKACACIAATTLSIDFPRLQGAPQGW